MQGTVKNVARERRSVNSEDVVGFGPVADMSFGGAALSVDGVNWYEVQQLRALQPDKFVAFDVDLKAAMAVFRGDGSVFGTTWNTESTRNLEHHVIQLGHEVCFARRRLFCGTWSAGRRRDAGEAGHASPASECQSRDSAG